MSASESPGEFYKYSFLSQGLKNCVLKAPEVADTQWFGTSGLDAFSDSSLHYWHNPFFWVKALGFLRHWLKFRCSGGSRTFTTDHLFHILSFNKYCLSIFYVPGTVLGFGAIRQSLRL